MRVHDFILGILIVIAGFVICSVAIEFPDQNDGKPGPWLFPVVLSLIFTGCGILLTIRGALHLREHPLFAINKNITIPGVFNIFVIIALVIFYIYFSEQLGFLITMEIVILGMMLILKTVWRKAIIVSACAVLAIYLIFAKGLLVPLPEGLFYF